MLDLTQLRSAVRSEGGVSRRLFLAYGAALAATPLLQLRAEAADEAVSFQSNPFTLGVASGDPDPTGVVLWTRLAPKPLEPDGGLGKKNIPLTWELAADDGFKKIVQSDKIIASADLAHSVRIEVKGLESGRPYFYRFRAGDAVSPLGRTKTAPAADAMPEQLKFAFASCQHWEQGLFTAYEQMAKDDPELVIHLGDYIYEYAGTEKKVRKHHGPKLKTLEQYRMRHAQYRSDPLLQAMHAQCPWIVTWDDHEVENNYAGAISEKLGVDPVAFLEQRANAYKAYYEAMPLRATSIPHGPDMTLYRTVHFGRLAAFQVLDTRQYRTDQPNGDGRKELNEAALDPKNSLLGAPQAKWLSEALGKSQAHWNVLAQQVMMGMVGYGKPGDVPKYSMDQWPGAAFERMKLIKSIADQKIKNPIVLTGDIHSHWMNNLRVDDRKHETPIVATEFVGTSISSGGNVVTDPKQVAEIRGANPGVQYLSRQRGYVRCTVTPKQWHTDYLVTDDVLKPGGKTKVAISFAVKTGVPEAEKA